MKRMVCLLALWAAPGLAQELSDDQTAALAVLTPLAQAQVPGAPGEILAACILASAKKRETRTLAQADADAPSQATIDLANKIVQRPAVVECMTTHLSK